MILSCGLYSFRSQAYLDEEVHEGETAPLSCKVKRRPLGPVLYVDKLFSAMIEQTLHNLHVTHLGSTVESCLALHTDGTDVTALVQEQIHDWQTSWDTRGDFKLACLSRACLHLLLGQMHGQRTLLSNIQTQIIQYGGMYIRVERFGKLVKVLSVLING